MSPSPIDQSRIIRKRKAAAVEDEEIALYPSLEITGECGNTPATDDATINDRSSQGTDGQDLAPEVMSDTNPHHSNEAPNEEAGCSAAKFKFRQRVYAKDSETGLFYEGIVRRAVFGVQHQRQIKIDSNTSEEDFAAVLQQEPESAWWYYIHYLGWNVQWDRWVAEGHLYEASESNKLFAKRLQEEVKNIKAELRSKGSGKPAASRVAKELERRMTLMEREHRIEERRRELSAQGKVMGQAEADALFSPAPKARNKWNKANIDKEIALRQRHLQGKRLQSSAELLVLPFTLKKIMVEEWEIITQSNMLASLPAAISIRQALDMFLKTKLEVLRPAEENVDVNADAVNDLLVTEVSVSKQETEWREMVDGVCLFFDQALPERLLYLTEQIQYDFMVEEGQESRRWSDVYGCEFLLRLFLRLPAVLVGELSELESKSILAKLNDLVRFLQKHQTTIFAQSYRRWNDMEQSRKDDCATW